MDIRDIARLSGYSLGTVSRVINGHPNVSDRAREQVLAVVREQGYEPNPNAKNLKMASRNSIVVFVKGAHNMLFAEMLEHAQSLLLAAGEETQVIYIDEDADEVQEACRHCRGYRVKGILFLGGDPAHFREGFAEIDVPSVLLSNTAVNLGFDNLSSFTTDDAGAAAQAIEMLCSYGHRRIGIIGGNRSLEQIGTLRLDGAVGALAAAGIDFDVERDYEPSRFSMEDGYDALVRLLWRSPDLTAIFALGDAIALGAMRAVFDMGKTVPEDISVVGFDGVGSSRFSVPRLTTVRQNTARIAERGVEALLARIQDPDLPPVHEAIPFQLYKRESVTPPSHARRIHQGGGRQCAVQAS